MNLAVGKRLVIILVFLTVLWFVLNYLANLIKSGKMKIPKFMEGKFYGAGQTEDLHKIELVQRKYINDACEMIVVDVNDEHILMAKSLNGTVSYIKTLEKPNS